MRDDWSELAIRAKEGDTDAFAELVEQFKRPLCAVIRPLLEDWHTTQDVAQAAFASVFEQMSELRSGHHFRSYLFRIARNLAVSWVRHRRALRFRSIHGLTGENLFDCSARAVRADDDRARDGPTPEVLARVRRIVLGLPNGYGSLLLMHHVEGMSVGEMSEVLGRSTKAVKAVLYRARNMARAYLKKAGLSYERVIHEL